MDRARALIGLGLLWVLGCQRNPEPLPPYAQATLRVDTDMPVPALIQRLRIDVFSDAGVWLESRDQALPDPQSWPASFTVYSEEMTRDSFVWVRLRAFPEARVRDYRGETFTESRFSPSTPPLEPTPRLVERGLDITPDQEPAPELTIDRLLHLRLVPGQAGSLDVLLSGRCVGTMAKLATDNGQAPVLGQASTCVDQPGQRAPVTSSGVSQASAAPSLVGTLGVEGCVGPAPPGSVCIVGGPHLVGKALAFYDTGLASGPEFLAFSSPFFLDDNEVSVARYRELRAAGFSPPSFPAETHGELTVDNACSYSSEPRGREDYALTCVDHAFARAFCQFLGGDLPSEVQWERAASRTLAGGRQNYPWGNEPVTCEHAVFGRLPLAGIMGFCEHLGTGPTTRASGGADRSVDGALGLAGGVAEWTLDAESSFADPCWQQAGLVDPRCLHDHENRILRGGSWPAPPPVLQSNARFAVSAEGAASFIGFRCAYPSGGQR